MNARRIVSLASYTVDKRTLHVTLTHSATRQWGAHLPEGTDTPAAAEYRKTARKTLEEKARIEGCTYVIVSAQMRQQQPWTLDAFEVSR